MAFAFPLKICVLRMIPFNFLKDFFSHLFFP